MATFTTSGPEIAPFTDFQQSGTGVSQTFDTSALHHLELIVGQGDYDFCIHDFKFLNAAGEGEAVAKRAVDAAARELVGLARSLERRFPGREPVPVALAGGLFHQGSALLTAFQRLLNGDMPRARLASEPVDPVLGALRLAREIPS